MILCEKNVCKEIRKFPQSEIKIYYLRPLHIPLKDQNRFRASSYSQGNFISKILYIVQVGVIKKNSCGRNFIQEKKGKIKYQVKLFVKKV